MKRKTIASITLILILIGICMFASCNEYNPQVKPETTAVNGKSAYELAVENGYSGTLQEWLLSLSGQDGVDGNTPYVGDNGNWFINGGDTGFPSKGENGKSSQISINSDGYWVIDGQVTAYRAREAINVFLPEEYDLAVNDNFQLFYRGVVQAVNPYQYAISVTCEKGQVFPRYFEWRPSEEDVGSYALKLTVYDHNGVKLGADTTVLNVHAPKLESESKNILCIGDSLTEAGYWVAETQRRFTELGGAPQGVGADYLNFVGTVEKKVGDVTTRYEGYGGWTWKTYCGEKSPFYDESIGDISFKSYCEKNNIETLDVVYFLLTWNGMPSAYMTDFSTTDGHFFYARKLIDRLHEEYPNAIVRCMGIQMPSQNGGMGYNYNARHSYGNAYGMLVTAMHYNATLEELCLLSEYSGFVKYVDIAGQFDTDYNMPSYQKTVNNRNDITETMGNNGVHPSVNGYYQIADAAFRSLCEVFSNKVEP